MNTRDPSRTSKKNITYLLGAGASAQALPLVNSTTIDNFVIPGIPSALLELSERLERAEISAQFTRETIVNEIRDLCKKSLEFGTIDTYAKYLFLKDPQELARLKNTLIFLFLYKQCIEKVSDKRALIFLTTILQNANAFPANVNILSWNYDFQIELAAMQFKVPLFYLGEDRSHNRRAPLIEHFPYNGLYKIGTYQLVHLNGCAGFYQTDAFSRDIFQEKIYDFNDLLRLMKKDNIAQNLNFAWEQNNQASETAMFEAERIAEQTDVLVVIGYTFPVFNREIDARIFHRLRGRPNLKIYFQDPVRDGEFLKSQFDLGNDVEIVPAIKDVRNYHVPIEM